MGMGMANADGFNTQPPEGGWVIPFNEEWVLTNVSTHSRPKAAGARRKRSDESQDVSTHSRPKAAGAAI